MTKTEAEDNSLVLFQGYDSIASAGRSTAVQGRSVDAGAVASSYYKICTTYDDYEEALNISASASASFGFGSATAKTDFMRKLKITNTSLSVVVYTRIVTASMAVKDPALKVAAPTDLAAFFKTFGDSYVSEVVTGGEYYAAYVFYSESVEEQQSVKASLEASGVGLTGSLSASFSMSLSTARTSIKTQQSLQQQIAGISRPKLPTEDRMIDFALNFGSLTLDAPTLIDYSVDGYEHVQGMPAIDPLVATRRLYEGFRDEPGLVDTYVALGGAANAADNVKRVYDTYGFSLDSVLDARLVAIRADMKSLDTLFQAMDDQPTKTWTAPAPPASLAFGSPSLRIVVNSAPYHGGGGGSAFDDFDQSTVASLSGLAKLSVRYKNHVHQLFATYTTADGRSVTLPTHGTDTAGDMTPELVLLPGERVSRVWAFYNQHIHQLIVTTNFGNMLTAPPQLTLPDGFPAVLFEVDDDHAFVGLSGRADNMIVGLAAVYVDFTPAAWSGAAATAVRTAA